MKTYVVHFWKGNVLGSCTPPCGYAPEDHRTLVGDYVICQTCDEHFNFPQDHEAFNEHGEYAPCANLAWDFVYKNTVASRVGHCEHENHNLLTVAEGGGSEIYWCSDCGAWSHTFPPFITTKTWHVPAKTGGLARGPRS